MSDDSKIVWKDGEAQKLFLESGFSKFADFLNLETEDRKVDMLSMREHVDDICLLPHYFCEVPTITSS